ncbi:hypothetical protein IAT40_004738 [Kwoniella sp. CBS 6097]
MEPILTLSELVYVCSPPVPQINHAVEGLQEISYNRVMSVAVNYEIDRQIENITYIMFTPRAELEWRGTFFGGGAYAYPFDWVIVELKNLLSMNTKHITFVGLENLSFDWAKSSAFAEAKKYPVHGMLSPKLED